VKTENGRIFLFLTLYDKKNKLSEFLKTRIKYVTSIDFGKAMTKTEVRISQPIAD
jgi:hypothetical protein